MSRASSSARSRYGLDAQSTTAQRVAGFGVQLLPRRERARRRQRSSSAKMDELQPSFPPGVSWFVPYDTTHVHPHLDRGSRQDAGRGDRARVPRHADLPAELPRDDHPDAGDSGRAARHVPRHVGARLHDQPAHAVRHGARDRHRRRRRDRRHRERRAHHGARRSSRRRKRRARRWGRSPAPSSRSRSCSPAVFIPSALQAGTVGAIYRSSR